MKLRSPLNFPTEIIQNEQFHFGSGLQRTPNSFNQAGTWVPLMHQQGGTYISRNHEIGLKQSCRWFVTEVDFFLNTLLSAEGERETHTEVIISGWIRNPHRCDFVNSPQKSFHDNISITPFGVLQLQPEVCFSRSDLKPISFGQVTFSTQKLNIIERAGASQAKRNDVVKFKI